MDPSAKPFELAATAQGASFYVERIDIASKLRELNQKWRWSRSFSDTSPLTNFQTLIHQISLLASLDTLSSFFLYKTQKQTIFCHSSQFPLYLTFRPNWDLFPLITMMRCT